MTRVSTINNYEEGGIKMVDVESWVKSLRLSWLKRIFIKNSGTSKNYLEYLLKDSGGLLLLNCNYNVNDFSTIFQFYLEMVVRFPKRKCY